MPDDLYFKLNCTLQPHFTGHFTLEGCSMTIEWGFSSVTLTYDQISDSLKRQLDRFPFGPDGVYTGIDPSFVSGDDSPNYAYDKHDLQNPENRDLRAEVFACLGLNADTTFHRFAEKFWGITRQEILSRMK